MLHGADKLRQKLRQMADNAASLHGEHQVPYPELFNENFMLAHSSHSSFEALVQAGGWVASKEGIEAIPDSEWNQHVAAHTDFPDWSAMQSVALADYVERRLSRGL